jgi:thioesterase domain-containing protein/acyl carrier protein
VSSFDDGWFRTGDLGWLDDDGFLYLVGRKDDVVSRGGVLVSLDSLEAALETHPAVRIAVAAALDHPSLGTDVVLGYVLAGEAGAVDHEELREHLRAHLPASQVPTRIVEIDEIPLLSSGKPSRAALLELVEASRPHAAPLSSLVPDPKLDGIELRLAALWCEVLLLDTAVLPDDNIFALGADSLHLVELCTMVADAFGIEVLPGELIGRPTLDDMAELLRESADRVERATLVPLRAGAADRVPLYVVPGAGGTLAAVHRFVFGLGAGRRVLGFEGFGLFRGEDELTSTYQLASRYVDELLGDVGDGPYVLAGMSFGSVVAQEMTRLLEGRGHPPVLLVMFDCPPPGVHLRPRLGARAASQVLRRLRRLRRAKPPSERVLARIHRQALITDEVRASHRAGPISTPTLLFTSQATRRRTGDPLLGWGQFVHAPIETVKFPGVHLELIRERAPETGAALDVRLVALDAQLGGTTT